jgi:hypothetical protein
LNLSELSGEALAPVLADLQARRATGGLHRVFGPRYMALRRLTEERLRSLFVSAGGVPERTVPHYFVLGGSRWYEGLAAATRKVVLPLADLPSAVTSFTYPDSFTAMGFGGRFGLPVDPRPYHDQVFRIEQLDAVVGRYGLPPDEASPADYDDYHRRPFERYIEVQLWSDGPVRTLLGTAP